MGLTFLIVAALSAAQLPPGTAEGVACVVERTPAADRLAIAEGALSETGARADAAEAEGRFGDSLAACAQIHGWDDPQMLRVDAHGGLERPRASTTECARQLVAEIARRLAH